MQELVISLLKVVGGIAMFLYGMNVMGDNLKKLGGGKLERVLEKLTSSPIKGVLLGALVTAVIQSSSATTVMVVGFVNSGIMQLSQAIGVIMGANIGTTITSWLISLTGIEGGNLVLELAKPENFTPVLALIGIVMIMSSGGEKKRGVGNILVGFSVLMFGMRLMIDNLGNVPGLSGMFTMFKNPLLGVVSGAVITAIMQSSSATIGILQALSMAGGVTYGSAIPIIMGQNIGSCAPTLISCIGAGKNAKRAAVVHLYFNLIGTIIFMVLFYGLNALIGLGFADELIKPHHIAIIHSMFNILNTIILLPFTSVLEKLAKLTIREGASVDAFAKLDERFLQTPSFAIDQCMTLSVNMGYIAKEAYELAVECMVAYDPEKDKKIMENEALADDYEDALGSYLVRISSQDLTEDDSRRVSLLLHAIGDIEQISDYSANILHNARSKNEKELKFSDKAVTEMTIMSDAVNEIFDRMMNSFSGINSDDVKAIAPLESVIDSLKKYLKKRHIRRVRESKCGVDTGFVFTDYITILEKVSDHCANIAGAMMELRESTFDVHQHMGEFKESQEYKDMYAMYSEKYALPFMVK